MRQDMGMVISKARQDLKLTQEEFAARLGVTPQAVSKWERGLGVPDLSMVEGICAVLQVDANVLFGIQGTKVTEPHSAVMDQEIGRNLFADPLVVEFGCDVIPCFAEGLKTDLVKEKRKQLARETGFLLPVTNFRDNVGLEPREVRILSYDRVLWQEKLETVDGDTYQQILDKVLEVCRTQYGEILNKQMVKQLLDHAEQQYPGLVADLVPGKVSYLQVKERLVAVCRKGGNFRDMVHILEELEAGLAEGTGRPN